METPTEFALLYRSPEQYLLILRAQGPELEVELRDGYNDPFDIGLVPPPNDYPEGFYFFAGVPDPLDPLKYAGELTYLGKEFHHAFFYDPNLKDLHKFALSIGKS